MANSGKKKPSVKKAVKLADIIKTEGDTLSLLIPLAKASDDKVLQDFTKAQMLLHEKYVSEVKEIAKLFNLKIDVKTILKS